MAPLNIKDSEELYDVNETIVNTSMSVVEKSVLYSESAMGFMCNPELAKHYAAFQSSAPAIDKSAIEQEIA